MWNECVICKTIVKVLLGFILASDMLFVSVAAQSINKLEMNQEENFLFLAVGEVKCFHVLVF